ncbi:MULTISPECIES: capsular polysaccharide export protein, LipB/KpsS family [Rhizobium]|uniref:Capsular biosynthesis protein n=1 Tax=Rhizobium tropici TaxID=398 RepID=A0A6P1C1I0_RHITR|nr:MULTISPECIES: capsule polysaccharide biosynthesis protein [Rhizobium]AGB71583.1 putative capsule polysaccharide biosynthesis protein [Rhizobium tropici CIAT 899]MBB4240056.1 capsular polysaccharide export protein [Rhizobium tropici]MBB5591326.1 capsular polysaccharide export protein [Rhizobium tropici]MBB6490590.1 capsular polysaccharide export protein [Rhizobium tropici]NEV10236.1 capsular biosynthesis protein [Rhizobium tropici]
MAAVAGEIFPDIGEKPWHPPADMRLGAAFFVRSDFPWLGHYFGSQKLASILSPGIGGILSWGGRAPAKMAARIARFRGLRHWHLEDGFLRSMGLGKSGAIPLSIVIDDLGLPVDANSPSRLERLIEGAGEAGDLGRAIREQIVLNRLSKYNHLPHRAPRIEQTKKRRILLVDQVVGDVSVGRALGSRASFEKMLADGLASDAQCLIRTHPDVMAGLRKGYLTDDASKGDAILVGDEVSVASILDVIDEVWTVSSQFGFDALLRGIPVRCYAAPFYAGWGVTEDRFGVYTKAALAGRRTKLRTVDQIAAAAFSLYPTYRDPADWRELDVFQAIDLIVAQQKAAA